MNKYAEMARKHWTEVAPQRVAQMEDPQSYFLTLGQEVETQVNQIAESLEGSDLPGEGYLEKVGRLNSARMRAEEIVLSDLVWIDPEEPEEGSETPSWIGQMRSEFTQQENDEWNLAIDEEYWAAIRAGKTPFKD